MCAILPDLACGAIRGVHQDLEIRVRFAVGRQYLAEIAWLIDPCDPHIEGVSRAVAARALSRCKQRQQLVAVPFQERDARRALGTKYVERKTKTIVHAEA